MHSTKTFNDNVSVKLKRSISPIKFGTSSNKEVEVKKPSDSVSSTSVDESVSRPAVRRGFRKKNSSQNKTEPVQQLAVDSRGSVAKDQHLVTSSDDVISGNLMQTDKPVIAQKQPVTQGTLEETSLTWSVERVIQEVDNADSSSVSRECNPSDTKPRLLRRSTSGGQTTTPGRGRRRTLSKGAVSAGSRSSSIALDMANEDDSDLLNADLDDLLGDIGDTTMEAAAHNNLQNDDDLLLEIEELLS